MGQPRRDFEYWKALIQAVARRWRTADREELEAELACHLYEVLSHPRHGIRDWKAFMTTVLNRKASNWIRDHQTRERPFVSFDEPFAETGERSDLAASPEIDIDAQIAIGRALRPLSLKLQNFFAVLREERGQVVRAAARLGIHRNTGYAWKRRLRRAFVDQGLIFDVRTQHAVGAHKGRKFIGDADHPVRKGVVVIRTAMLQELMARRVSGTQMRILLWVLREKSGRKQKAVPFSWSGVAQALALDRTGVYRAGKALIGARILWVKMERIGIWPQFGLL